MSRVTGYLYQQLAERLKCELGVYYPPDRHGELEKRVQALAYKLEYDTPEKFLETVLIADWNREKLELLSQAVTIGETYFFREPALWDYIENEVLPELFLQKRRSTLSVSSAACSNGAEPFRWHVSMAATMRS